MKPHYLFITLAFLFIVSFSNQSEGDRQDQMTQQEAQHFFDRYSSLWMAGDIEGWLDLWVDSEDIVQMPPNEPRVVGMNELRVRNSRVIAAARYSDVLIKNLDIRSSGDLAFASGVYTMTITPLSAGTPSKLDAKYLSVFERQDDGSWKLIRDAFSPNKVPE